MKDVKAGQAGAETTVPYQEKYPETWTEAEEEEGLEDEAPRFSDGSAAPVDSITSLAEHTELPPGMAALEDGTIVAVSVMSAYATAELLELAGFLRANGLDITVLAVPLA